MMDELQTYIPRFGPDQILPASSYQTHVPDGATLIYMKKTGPSSEKPISVYSFFKEIVTVYPKHAALSVKRNNKWISWTYEQYFEECKTAAKAMIKLGLQRFHGVCIMGFNSPEWMISNFGTIFAGGLSAGVYTTNSPEACRHLANNCQAEIIIVENKECLDKFLAVKRFLPEIKAIVQWSGVPEAPGVLSWLEMMEIGKYETDEALQERLSLQAINQCCTLIYTSGTTGPSKGVMCTQDHMTWSGRQFKAMLKIPNDEENTGVSYLPLCHTAAQMSDMYGAMNVAAHLYFAQPDALKGTLGQTLQEIQPTGFIAVPRVWEKIYEKIQEKVNQSGTIKRAIGNWAKYHGTNYFSSVQDGRELSIMEQMKITLATSLILNKVKEAIGLSRARYCYTGTAPLARDIEEYFMSIGIPIMEIYGLSETLSLCSIGICETNMFKVGSVGKIVDQIEAKVIGIGEHTEGEGEICVRGRSVCMGYLGMLEKTKETIDKDNWLHTGDLGRIDDENFLFITGRLKELIITAGGENIPPVLIEMAVKKELPCLSNCMLVGDRRKYLSMLLTLKAEVDLDTLTPLQELTPDCVSWIKAYGSTATTVREVILEVHNNPGGMLYQAIEEGIQRYNHNAASNAQKIHRWVFLPHDLSLPTGELNHTLKIKRACVLQKYADTIDEMYARNALSSKL